MRERVAAILVGLSSMSALGCSAPPCPKPDLPAANTATVVDPLAALSIPARPDWMDKYAGSTPGDPRFFHITRLMETYALTRSAAVELQNHYRDATRADPEGDRQAQFDEALAKARRGEYESPRRLERLKSAPFIVVFDLDETLYDQYYDADCADVSYANRGKTKRIKLTPGWEAAIDRVVALGGAVVLFSANLDDTNYRNFDHIEKDGAPLHRHESLSGFLTNSHLVLQHKDEGEPIVRPSKDLRILDETLKRVILVDDNPLRVIQRRNLRVFKKFDADIYCRTDDAAVKKAYDEALSVVVDEVEEAASYAKSSGVDFVTAYAPYSQMGRIAVEQLTGRGMSEVEARTLLRRQPELIDDDF